MKRYDFTPLLEAMLVPERVFNVRGLCRMNGLPDIEEHLKRMNWLEQRRDGTAWCGPSPQGNEELQKLADVVSRLHENVPYKQPEPKPAIKLPSPEILRPMLRGLETWNGTEDERYCAMLRELIEARSVAFTIMPWKFKLPYAIVPVCKSLNWVTRAKGAQGTSWMGPSASTDDEVAVLAIYLKERVAEYLLTIKR